MAGQNVIQGAQPVEWVEETSFATAEDAAAWNWFGIGTSFSVSQGVETESITYLPEFGASNKLEKRTNVAHREIWEGDITYHPQNLDLFQYFTGSAGGTSDDITTIQVGMADESNGEFARLMGGIGEELTLSGGEDETFEVSGSFIFADGEDFGTTDYTGTDGSHASEDTTEPYAWKDVANVQYGGTELGHAIESLELTISNEIAVVRDPDASRESLIVALVPVDREISVDIDVTYSDFSMAQDVRAYQPQDLVFDIGPYSFTVTGVQFPEMPFEFTADDLISDSLASDPCDSLTWTGGSV